MPTDRQILAALRARIITERRTTVAAGVGVSERCIYDALRKKRIGRPATRQGLIRYLGLAEPAAQAAPAPKGGAP